LRDFRAEWDESIRVPIRDIENRFKRLKPGGRPVKLYPRVGPEIEKELHAILVKIDPAYDEGFNKAEDLKKMPAMKSWMNAHCLITPYCFSIQRCKNIECCGEFRSPVEGGVRELVMQRQPTPRLDTLISVFLEDDQGILDIAIHVFVLHILSECPVGFRRIESS